MSYGVPCSWEAVADLDNVCLGSDSTFNASFPVSKDLSPTIDDPTQISSIDDSQPAWDQCAVHGYCSVCLDDSGVVNSYCAAVLSFYESATASVLALNDLEYWCDNGRRASIKSGGFTDKCTREMRGVSGACSLELESR